MEYDIRTSNDPNTSYADSNTDWVTYLTLKPLAVSSVIYEISTSFGAIAPHITTQWRGSIPESYKNNHPGEINNGLHINSVSTNMNIVRKQPGGVTLNSDTQGLATISIGVV